KAAVAAVLVRPAPVPAQVTTPNIVTGVLSVLGKSLLANNNPVAPPEAPVSLAVLAWGRRQYSKTLLDDSSSMSSVPVLSSQTVDLAVSGDTAISAPAAANLVSAVIGPPAFVQVSAATPQTTSQSNVSVTYTRAQIAGNTNILAIGWNNATS